MFSYNFAYAQAASFSKKHDFFKINHIFFLKKKPPHLGKRNHMLQKYFKNNAVVLDTFHDFADVRSHLISKLSP